MTNALAYYLKVGMTLSSLLCEWFLINALAYYLKVEMENSSLLRKTVNDNEQTRKCYFYKLSSLLLKNGNNTLWIATQKQKLNTLAY